ncbi:hypothetical protein KKH39_00045 [Patescibacteria group bacterium]|nr:hypothetical protein [Patescibacteria group bacterium]
MSKQIKTLLIIIVLILLGGLAYLQYNSKHEANNENTNVDIGNEQNAEEIDTSEWVTFEDEELGISYKHPAEGCSWNGAGPGTSASNAIGCGESVMIYKPINYSYNSDIFSNFNSMTLHEITEYTRKFNKNKYDFDQYISEVEQVNINNYNVYKFSVDKAFSIPCDESDMGSCFGMALDKKNDIIFIENTSLNKILVSIIPYGDVVSEAILSTITFLD